MIQLLTAIQTRFNETEPLHARFPDGCWSSLAKNGSALPLCVLSVASAVPNYDTGDTYETTYAVQFAVYAESDTEALQAAQDVKGAFDFCEGSLTLAGETCLKVQRTNEMLARTDEQVWQAIVEYQIDIEGTY